MSHLPDQIEIQRSGPLHGAIRPPGSKSITNRALACAALAEGASTLIGALDSEDTQVMIAALRLAGHAGRGRSCLRQRSMWKAAAARSLPPAANCTWPIAARRSAFWPRWSPWATASSGSTARRGCASGRSATWSHALDQLGADAASEGPGRLPAGGRSGAWPARRPAARARRHLEPVPQRPADGGAVRRTRRSS